ncbi:MAG: hypothetical protein ACXVAX_11360 [Pseudobdellovibrio sp.]
MKYFLLFILTAQLSFAATVTENKAVAPTDAVTKIEAFSKKKLNPKTDLEEVKKTIQTLLLLDNDDPSRTAVMILSESYNKNKALYNKAIKSVETKENKQQLLEIKKILANFSKEGNG